MREISDLNEILDDQTRLAIISYLAGYQRWLSEADLAQVLDTEFGALKEPTLELIRAGYIETLERRGLRHLRVSKQGVAALAEYTCALLELEEGLSPRHPTT